MAKNLNVSLAFTANTNEAIAAIKRLQKELNGLATGSSLKNSGISQITPEIQRAMVAAGELQAKLEAATNLKTGKLDLGQFSDSLKKGGVSLQQYANQLNTLGPAGRQAFTNLAQSIIQAEAPLIRCSQRVRELGTTLANTARWQLSSSMLHGFMGAVSSAYGYAQDLNKSLNDIRIVTGASVAEMDAFAAKANKAARALSTTTNEYAKASLIYFQQGDTQAQAMEKAAVTAKMANVTGQSADVVSNQLTAIWNNFNKEGDVAYEHYADVLTKLGAATASSTDEIAGGLEKFAGIADTIGLSYEYAASALATITATSRESEEVVGTALKTIFARIQGLKQGDTLEDGTTLNKYSEALQKVGISIFDQTGELKNMDNILEEMAAKWVTLSKDQQLALAQTVAGVRQYNQMVTLMDNWDFMDKNLATARSANGELDAQAEIYAESWQAARDEVRAAAEELYTKLLDDDFFIGFLNGIEKVIDGVSGLVDAFGGLEGVLATIGAYVTRIFQKEMAQGLRTTAQNIKGFINPNGVQAEQDAKKAEAIQALRNMKSFTGGQEGKAENAALSREASMQERLYQAAKNISEEEAKQLQIQMDSVRAMDKRAIAAAKNLDVAEKELKSLQDQNRLRAKMDAQAEARDRGRTKAGKALLEQAHKGVGQNTASFGENERQVVLAAEARAQQAVRSRHNFTADVSLDGYEDEIALELTRQLKGTLADLDLKDGVDKQSIQGQLDKAIREAVVKATSGVDVEGTGENVNKYQAQVQKAGNLNAQGIALSKLGAGGLTTKGADAKGLESIYTQLKTRIEAAQQAASELKAEVKDSGNSSREIAQLNGVFESLQTELEDAKGDAEALQRILDKLADESGAGELISRVSQNIGGEGGYIAQEANDGINQPSFDMSGQFESATNVGLKNIQSYNANVDVKNSQQELEDSFNQTGQGTQDWADGIANATSTIMALGSAISSVQGAIDVFNDPDATGWDKVSAIISVIIGVLPVASSLMTMFGSTAAASGAAAGAGMTAALGPIGWIILAVTALIAIFVLLGSAIAANSPEGQLKSAQEATEKTAQAAQNAKSAYEELLSTINRYDSAKESLEGLAKGTDEYTEALMEANAAARELIDTYGLIKFSVDENGLINLDEQELETKKSEHRDRVEDTSSALTGAQKYQNQKEDVVTISNLRQEAYKDSAYYGTDYYNGLINDANISKVLAASREAEGGADAYFAEGKQNIAATMGWDPDALTSYQNDFINALMANSAALNEANVAILANAAANEAATKAQLTQNLSDEEKFQDSEYQNELVEAALNAQGSTEKAADDKLAGMTQDQMYDEYAKMMGYTNNGIGTWLDGKQEFLDKDGNKIELTPEQVKAQMKEMYSQEGMEQNALNLVDTMNKVMARADENKGVISTAITGDTEKLTIGQQGMSADQVAAMVTDEEAQAMGFESAAAFGESFASATESFAGEWQSLMGNYVDSVSDQMQTMFDNGELDNLTLGQSENLANAFETAYATSGQAGMDVLAKMFTDAGEYSDEFANALGTIDWTTATPETLQDALDAAGVVTHYTADELKNLINVMNEGAMGFENAANKYKALSEIVDSLKSGDTITAEQFKELGPGMEDYFMRMADGTYKLIGDAEAFYAAVNAQQMEGFENTITAKTEDNAEIENVLNHDIGSLGKMDSTTMGGHVYTGNGQFVQNTDVANTQLDFLEQTGYDPAQVQQWRDDMQAGTLDVKALTTAVNEQTTALGGAAAAEEYLTQQMDANNTEIQQSYEAIASTATSVDELNDMLTEGRITTEAYDKALQNAFEQEVETEGFDVEELNDYAEALMNSESALVETREEANRLAVAHAKMERGVNDLVDNWDSWNEALENGSEKEKVATMGKMKKAMADIIGVDVDQISDKFINNAEAMELMEKAANGDMEALDALGPLFAKEYIADIGINNTNFQGDLATLQTDLLGMLEQFQMEDIEIGTSLDTSGYAMAMTEMMAAAGTDIDTINSILAGMGFEPEVSYVEIPVDQYSEMVNSGTTTWNDSEGNSYTAVLDTTLQADESGMVKVPVINGSKTTFKGGGSSAASSGAKKGGGGGGGGGGKPKKADKVKKTDVVERYKEIDDKLDDIADKMNDASKAADRLWGPARLKEMKKVNEALEEEIDALKQKRKEAQDNLETDKQALKDTIKSEAGVTITDADFDENGNFTKYDEVLTDLYEEIDAATEAANADGNADEDEQEKIAAIQERIDKVKEAISQYDETRELKEDLTNNIQDKIYEWQDNNYAQLQYKLEVEIETNEAELEVIEYYLNRVEDDLFSVVEVYGYLNQQSQLYADNLKHQEEHYADLQSDYFSGKISLDQYKESLIETQGAIISNLESLDDLIEKMQDYYGNVLSMAIEEISIYTDQMEHLNSVLDHYSNIQELIGKQADYKTKGTILAGTAANLRNELDVQKELFDIYNAEAQEWSKKMSEATEGSLDYETYKKNWQAAQEAANEAQEAILSKTEEWAEAMKALIENEMAEAAKILEESLTGGVSFDELLTSMERRSSLQEEYLTTTNQIYETNKLMRKAQQEIDKTSNTVAKRRLSNFVKETSELQNQTKLSQYELDIQQAKYDLLLAEIALEEAQNTKSTVKLQRDAEGNFGYVYTADANAISEAEQELADKQNALYNLGLKGANDYMQKYAETMQEAQDAITELTAMWMNGEIASEEEYQRRKAEIQEYYYEKLKQYSELYQIALTTDSRVVADAWSTDFSSMVVDIQEWNYHVGDYFDTAREKMELWESVCQAAAEDASLDDIASAVDKVVDSSDALKKVLLGEGNGDNGVVGALREEIAAANDLSEAYVGIQNEIDKLIKKYQDLLKEINEEYVDPDTPVIPPAIENEDPTPDPEPTPQPEPSKPSYDEKTKRGVALAIWNGGYGWGNGATRKKRLEEKGFDYKEMQKIVDDTNPNGNWKSRYGISDLSKYSYSSFDTGGYTGNWDGPFGKFAMLHQKELVLNAGDTENFLQAMDILDKIVSAIDLYSMNSQLGGLLSSPSIGNFGEQGTLEQQVHIEASFPAVQDRNEIEEAFNTLVNRASQYANRK